MPSPGKETMLYVLPPSSVLVRLRAGSDIFADLSRGVCERRRRSGGAEGSRRPGESESSRRESALDRLSTGQYDGKSVRLPGHSFSEDIPLRGSRDVTTIADAVLCVQGTLHVSQSLSTISLRRPPLH